MPQHNRLHRPVSREEVIFQERFRQAQQSFTLARWSTLAGVVVTLSGPVLLCFGNLSAGAVTTAVGGAASTVCWKLNKDANDRFDKLAEDILWQGVDFTF